MTNVRIARQIRSAQGAVLRAEEAGAWIVPVGDPRNRMAHIHRELQSIRQEEPDMDWKLQSRGTDTTWHDWGKY